MKRTSAAVGAMALTFLAYLPALGLPPLGEAYEAHDPRVLSRIEPRAADRSLFYYRPASHWVDHVWYRVTAGRAPLWLDRGLLVAAHAAGAGLLALACARSSGSGVAALLAALLYGLHPLAVPGVAYGVTRWPVLVPLLFLLIAAACERGLERPRGDMPRLLFLCLAPLLLGLALLAEPGALGMGILGAWLVWRCRDRGEARFSLFCLAPIAPVPVVYLALRAQALGDPLVAYGFLELSVGDRVLAYGRNLVHDLALLLSPLRTHLLDVAGDAPAFAVALRALPCLMLLALPLAHAPARRFLAARPLPLLGLALFVPFQANGLWLLEREAVGAAGFDRGYVYVLPLLCLCLLAADAVAAAAPRARRIAAAALAGFVVASAAATHASLALWTEGGRLLAGHERQLAPLLERLPPDAELSVRGFPHSLRAPFLPRAYVYLRSASTIFSAWAGRPLRVYWNGGDAAPPLGFSGPMLENVAGVVRVGREDAAEAVEAYLVRWDGGAPPDARPLLAAEQSLGLGEMGAVVAVDLQPLDFGVLRYEYRVLEGRAVRHRPRAQVYFKPASGSFDEFLSVRVDASLDPGWHEVRIPLFQCPRWVSAGRVVALRVRPFDLVARLELRGLRLENDLEWAHRLRGARGAEPRE